jgi:hypothetical protein
MKYAYVVMGWVAVLAGCVAEDSTSPNDDDAAGESSDGMPTADLGEGGGPTEAGPCPLVGVFRDCSPSGVQFCDVIAGALVWGPCLASTECGLLDPEGCTSSCELVEGVPTVVEVPDNCGGESTG